MRRFTVTSILLFIVLGLTAVLQPRSTTLAASPAPIRVPVTLVATDDTRPDNLPFSLNTAADTCSAATNLSNIPGGDESIVNFMTESSSDPQLSCAWGTPPAPRGKQGYRTVWYKFTAPHSGVATIDTYYSTYDTILAVYQGSCDSLAMAACNDDNIGFSSKVTLNVSREQTYYIEVADWQSSASGTASLSLAVWIQPVASRWVAQPNMTMPRSRHAMVKVGTNIYVIGGVTEMGTPLSLTNSMQRLNTVTGEWTTLQAMPGNGLANTTAVYMDGRIFIPGGYDGNNTLFNGTHWTYTIDSGLWGTAASPSWPNGQPLAWGTAVVAQKSGALPFDGYFLVGGTNDLPPIDNPIASPPPAVPSSKVFFYLLDNDAWATNYPDLQVARYAHTAAWIQDRICVAGGIGMNDAGTANILLLDGECLKPGGDWVTISNMNHPRYSAGSAVGPDGKWYVFGGIDGSGDPVEFTEVYDLATNTWTTLGAAYDLGDFVTTPARAWPRGTFIGNALWVIGGHDIDPGTFQRSPLTLVSKLSLILPNAWLPFVATVTGPAPAPNPPNNNFATAFKLNLNQAQFHSFNQSLDVYDSFYFDLGDTRSVTVRLSEIPLGSEYDLAVYSSNKLLWGVGDNPGNQDEAVHLTLPAGRYYILIHRLFPAGPPDTDNYRIIVEG
ncbi:MAG: kelch repeat-containing protein [Chloroflexota bacterium]